MEWAFSRKNDAKKLEWSGEYRENTKARECVFGLVGNGFAIVVADASIGYKFVGPNTTEDKITVLDSHKLLAAIGPLGDRHQFTKNVKMKAVLSQFRDEALSTTAAAANFIRAELAPTLCYGRIVDMLLAGYDEETGPSLYHIDCTTSVKKVDKGAFGGGGASYSLSKMDHQFHSGMSLEEAIALVDACIEEIRSNLALASPHFVIKIVDKDGAREYAWRKLCKDATARRGCLRDGTGTP